MIKFANGFGELVVEQYGKIKPIAEFIDFYSTPEFLRFDLETAERIVLITENRNSQIWIRWQDKSLDKPCTLIIHDSPSTGWIARIIKLASAVDDPGFVIDQHYKLRHLTQYCIL